MEVIVLFVAPALLIGFLFVLPFISGTGEKSFAAPAGRRLVRRVHHAGDRHADVYGRNSPWSPGCMPGAATPVPVNIVKKRTPLEIHGALVFQNKQCRNCHSLGQRRRPAWSGAGRRCDPTDADEMVRQVIQGGGNMPAYGKKLTPGRSGSTGRVYANAAAENEPEAKPARSSR